VVREGIFGGIGGALERVVVTRQEQLDAGGKGFHSFKAKGRKGSLRGGVGVLGGGMNPAKQKPKGGSADI